jgi:heme/copper-type cytochrome/quinol oxidase subunit 2
MRAIVDLHDYVFIFLTGVLIFVLFILFSILRNNALVNLSQSRSMGQYLSAVSPLSPHFYIVALSSIYSSVFSNAFNKALVFYYDFFVGTRVYYFYNMILGFKSSDALYHILSLVLSLHVSLRNEAELNGVFGSYGIRSALSQPANSLFSLTADVYYRITTFPWNFFVRYGSSFTQFYLFTELVLAGHNDSFDSSFMFEHFYSYQLRVSAMEAYRLTHNDALETVWTLVPSLILVFIAVPSLLVLFALDEVGKPVMTVKAIGHQWYWSYEVTATHPNLGTKTDAFDSYMVATAELSKGDHRNLEVDNSLRLPFNSHIRLIVTSMDVLHSWAVPALGVKIDAVPGRLNQVGLFIDRPGVFFGQCSEICGPNHGFMPICIKADMAFSHWLDAYFNVEE